MIPEPLRLKLAQEAAREKVSLGELIRRALEKFILARERPLRNDPFFSGETIFEDEGPTDVALRHDDYLYGGSPHRTIKPKPPKTRRVK